MRQELLDRIQEGIDSRSIDLSELEIKDEEMHEIIGKIKELVPTVISLDFDKNEITDQGAKYLGELLHDFHDLQELSLERNSIGEEGALSVFALKKDIEGLEIPFFGNKITDSGKMLELEQSALQSKTHRM